MNPAMQILSFTERALEGEDVQFSEIEGLELIGTTNEHSRLIFAFWRALIIFVDDFDVRQKDQAYEASKRKGLIAARDDLIAAGVLPTIA